MGTSFEEIIVHNYIRESTQKQGLPEMFDRYNANSSDKVAQKAVDKAVRACLERAGARDEQYPVYFRAFCQEMGQMQRGSYSRSSPNPTAHNIRYANEKLAELMKRIETETGLKGSPALELACALEPECAWHLYQVKYKPISYEEVFGRGSKVNK